MNKYIVVNIEQQVLQLFETDHAVPKNLVNKDPVYKNDVLNTQITNTSHLIKTYNISTAKNGIGSVEGSGCTPLGVHTIAKKIGANAPINSVFVGRVPTGEIYNDALGKQYPNRDWILSRILWLSGCEEGVNKGHNRDTGTSCDTFERYIYIHGTPDSEPMGMPLSHGCIRMHNDDVIELYDKLEEGTPIVIVKSP